MGASWKTQSIALDVRDVVRKITDERIQSQRPAPDYAEVQSIDRPNWVCTVIYPGEVDEMPVQMGTIQPGAVGDWVRINGVPGARYVEDVMGEAYIAGAGGGGSVNEVWIGSTAPTDPAIELWYDPDATAPAIGGNYVHDQTTPASTWVINHDLGFYPGVRIEDSAGSDVEGEVTHNSTTQMTLVFSAAFSGKAYLS